MAYRFTHKRLTLLTCNGGLFSICSRIQSVNLVPGLVLHFLMEACSRFKEEQGIISAGGKYRG